MERRSNSPSIPFEKAGFYLIGLLVLAIVGFWNSYFSKLFDGSNGFNGYFHFHAVMASSWLLVLIVQPLLIRKKRWRLHRQVGLGAHFLMILFFISVLLLTHAQQTLELSYIGVLIPFRDLLVLSIAYFIAMRYRKVPSIHARGMIATGIAFIEPALIRALGYLFPSLANKYLWTIAITYVIIIAAMYFGRHYKRGQWVFPLILAIYIVIHSIIIFRLPLGFFEVLADWFVGLPLT